MKVKRKVGVFKNKIVLFMIITLNKLVIEGNFLSLIRTIYIKPTVNITLNGETLDASSLRSGTREDVSVTLPIQHCTESPSYYKKT